MILFGHPTGNPNSHQAALSHFERGQLAALVVPWMPSAGILRLLSAVPVLRAGSARLARRRFEPLVDAPKIQGRMAELSRLLIRVLGGGNEGLAYQANDWLMQTMARVCVSPTVTSVHSYEDCSLEQFEVAKRLGKACIYDMPACYYPYWEVTQAQLGSRYSDWLPSKVQTVSPWVRPKQKLREMELADLVLVPSSFVQLSVEAMVNKRIARVAYGVDSEFWCIGSRKKGNGPLRFVYAGQCSVRKGVPLLIEAWSRAALGDAELHLVGAWRMSEQKLGSLPRGVRFLGQKSSVELRECMQHADVFVFPSFYEGFGLVVLEAMSCGLPVIASDTTAGADIIDASNGRIFPSGRLDVLVEQLKSFSESRDNIAAMAISARKRAETYTWERYRHALGSACSSLI